ncbi:MAG: MOSC domain-containing protein [Bacteroidetes bacterium]|nr:MOSC domain-containing protein [Bacteroidota bacterium]
MLSIEDKNLKVLKAQFAKPGRVEWIGLRPERAADLISVETANAIAETGLKGDHYQKKGGKRQVTLIMQEHLQAAASVLGVEAISPMLTRRNIVVSGINLISLKGKKFKIGSAILEYTGECHPCSRMEENLGKGGYNAMRHHGGITCRVLASGEIGVGGEVVVAE